MADRVDNRKGLAALRPCGCWCMLMVVSDPDHNFAATPKMVGEFHRDAFKARLKVIEFDGPPPMPYECETCKRPAAKELFS